MTLFAQILGFAVWAVALIWAVRWLWLCWHGRCRRAVTDEIEAYRRRKERHAGG